MKEYDVSVVVVCYNPDLSKLKRTLASVLLQTGVRVQIILADDGSANVYFPEIRSYFSAKNFGEYKLLGAEQNEGTCHNFYKGVTAASGVYIKGISPGDYLYEKDTLAKWVRFMENHQIDVCFGDAVFFREEEGGGIVALKRRYGTRPLRCDFYTLGEFNQHKACRSFFLLNDVVLGPKMIFKRKIVETYCAQLLGKIRYCEDKMTGLMLLDGIKIVHYPCPVLMYEYSSGISTMGSDHWRRLLDVDEVAFEQMVVEKGGENAIAKRYGKYLTDLRREGRGIRSLLKRPEVFCAMVARKLYVLSGRTQSPVNFDRSFMQRLKEEN